MKMLYKVLFLALVAVVATFLVPHAEAVAGTVAIMAVAPFPINPELVAVALGYKNTSLIADQVLPRVPVTKQQFKLWIWDKAAGFRVPDTRVGRHGAPSRVEFSATEKDGSTADYGLDDPIPQSDIDQAAASGIDLLSQSVMQTMDLILLDREVRAASLVFSAATYPAGNKVKQAAGSQFSDAAFDAAKFMLQKLDVPTMRPNTIVFGQAAWTDFRTNPAVVKATNKNSGDAGAAAREAVADLLEVQQVLVGQGWLNTAKKGQVAAMSRVWGKHVSLLYLDPLANPSMGGNRITFGCTPQFGSRLAGSFEDKDIGAFGGQRVRVAESVREYVVASDCGYFIEDATA